MAQHEICRGLFTKHLNVSGWRYIIEYNDLSQFQMLLSYLPTVIGVIVMPPYIICQIISFFYKEYDFPGTTEIVCIIIPLCLVEMKMLTFLLNVEHFIELFDLFTFNLFEFVTQERRERANEILQKQVSKINKLLLIFVCTNFIPHLAWQLVPLFEIFELVPVNNSSDSVTKIIPGWYPFDLTSYTVYSLVFAYESVLLTFCGFYMTSSNALLLQLNLMLCGHITVLIDNFRDIGKYHICTDGNGHSINNKCCSSIEGNTYEEYKLAAKCLTASIENHQVIMRLATKLKTVYSIFVAAEFLTGLFVICILLFQVTILPEKRSLSDLLKIITFLTSAIWPIFMVCWLGSALESQSLNLNHGIYESNWYCLPNKTAKKIPTVLQMSQKVLSLTAGFTYRANLELFTATMRATYSFYTVLVNVYNQK